MQGKAGRNEETSLLLNKTSSEIWESTCKKASRFSVASRVIKSAFTTFKALQFRRMGNGGLLFSILIFSYGTKQNPSVIASTRAVDAQELIPRMSLRHYLQIQFP